MFLDPTLYQFYCYRCSLVVSPADWPVRCFGCGHVAAQRYVVPWPPRPPAFGMQVKIRHAGRSGVRQDVSLKPSVSADGTVATVRQEIDKLDADPQHHRYRKKVVNARGVVVKNVDVTLGDGKGHGDVGTLQDEPPGPLSDDRLRVTLDFKP